MNKPLEEMSSEELKGTLSNLTASVSEAGEQETRSDIRQITQEPGEELSFSRDPGIPIPQEVDQQQRVANAINAFQIDIRYIRDSLGAEVANELVEGLQSGEIKVPEDSEKDPNVFYNLGLGVLARRAKQKNVSVEKLYEMLPRQNDDGSTENAERLNPKRSLLQDTVIPGRVRPPPKPKPKAEKTYKIPDLSTEDMVEALKLLMEAHPERFR